VKRLKAESGEASGWYSACNGKRSNVPAEEVIPVRCPFLREMTVKYCGLCRLKMIPVNGADFASERCSGPGYLKCSMARNQHDGLFPQDRCPFLCVGDVHYCALAQSPRLIPCNKKAFSRCTDEGHKYCQIYLSMVDPRSDEESDAQEAATGVSESPADRRAAGEAGAVEHADEDEVPMPEPLAFAANHMWLDRGDGKTCHIGVDAFFGRVLGKVDEVSYPLHREENRPTVRFLTGGVDFDLVFPNAMQITEINAHLVVDPTEVLRDPYGRGWLFEGAPIPNGGDHALHPLEEGLVRGEAARRWMREEEERLARFVHGHVRERHDGTGLLMQDGGRLVGHLASALGRGALVRLHSEFFSLPGRRDSA
jgi:glycine cleavage system H lipoate-binding protein